MTLSYLARRIMQTGVTLFLMSLIVFGALRAIPGDAAVILLGEYYGFEEVTVLRERMGLDDPVYVQYFRWIGNALRGDLGKSWRSNESITYELARRLPVTFQLALLAFFTSLLIALPAGLVSAIKRNTWFDRAARVIALIGISLPNFWVGLMLILAFALSLRWIPSGGYVSIAEGLGPYLRTMAAPAITLGTAMAASTMRITRASTLEALTQDYIRTARSKGLREFTVLTAHAFKNALIPILTVVGVQFGLMLAGSVAVETVFSIPGVSRFLIDGVTNRDYPVVMATVLIISLGYMIANLTIDLLYVVIDPRIRYE